MARAAAACLFLLVMVGCGSSSSPPLVLSCSVHARAGGGVRADVSIKNTTDRTLRGFVFGPALAWIQRIYPATLAPSSVTVNSGHSNRNYVAFVLPHVRPNRVVNIVLGFAIPRGAWAGFDVSTTARLNLSDPQSANFSACRVHGST